MAEISESPKIDWDRIARRLSNLLHGVKPDLAGWNIPMLAVTSPDTPDVDLAERLAAAFYKAMEANGSTGDGLWDYMSKNYHRGILAAL